MTSAELPNYVAASLAQCIGCHDQCLFTSADVIASGRQDLVMSRLAAAVRDAAIGDLVVDDWLIDSLFLSFDQGAQKRHCIVLDGSQDPRDWLRWARRELPARAGVTPTPVRELWAARDASESRDRASGDVDVLIVTDQVTGALDPSGHGELAALLERLGRRTTTLTLSSSGTVEHFFGLDDEVAAAAAEAARALLPYAGADLVTDDPAIAFASTALWPTSNAPRVRHVSEYLTEADLPAGGELGTAVVDDVGLLAGDLGVVLPIRALLRAAGYSVVEPPSTGRHARDDGPMAGYPDPALAARVGEARRRELVDTGADLIVTVAPWSRRNLGAGATRVASLAGALLAAQAVGANQGA